MIDIIELRRKYKKIILWGCIPSLVKSYSAYLCKDTDYIVDSDVEKQGKYCLGYNIKAPHDICREDYEKIVIVILTQSCESEIYSNIRRIGIHCDVYTNDMVIFNKDAEAYTEDKYYFCEGQYTAEKHIQVLIFLLKVYGVKKIIVSPGTTNMSFVYSLQSDPYFEMYSCIDERSAVYMACGMAETTNEPVALSCTGATASRNYMGGLTEAYYSKLPIIAITSSQKSYKIGNEVEQVTDRTKLPSDIAKLSIEIDEIHNIEERKYCELKINKALNTVRMNGGGPVHINLITNFCKDFSTKTLPKCKTIRVIEYTNFPELKGKIAIYVKSHSPFWDEHVINLIDEFCSLYDAVVVGDHLSNYKGHFFIQAPIIFNQEKSKEEFDIIICIGEINNKLGINCKAMWRISENEQITDPDLKLEYFFKMRLIDFFSQYVNIAKERKIQSDKKNYLRLNKKYFNLINSIPELPFSNIWIAKNTCSCFPRNSVVYLGIVSTLKSWNLFLMDSSIDCYSTVGGFGIEGTMSSMIGASIANEEKLNFAIIGDLSFFDDMNVLGNRHIKSNVRVMILNNNGGNEQLFQNGLPQQEKVPKFIAASGHYCTNPKLVIQSYIEALGYRYLCARSKEEYLHNLSIFFAKDSDKPVVFEIIYDYENDLKARSMITKLE